MTFMINMVNAERVQVFEQPLNTHHHAPIKKMLKGKKTI